ncbi:MAG: heavy metal-binding domain-containing protein [Dehalococcoidia bacterium]
MTGERPGDVAIPEQARERLQSMRQAVGGRRFFTSDLSVNEFVLVKEAGFDPVGLVLGSSIYHIGFQMGRGTKNQELTVLTQAMYNARELAMARMEAEADALGADGVIGVRLIVNKQEWGEALAEFMAIGTAVVAQSGQSHRTVTGKPFTSDLSGQDFWTLLRAGYRPLALVMGNCVYHVAHQGVMQSIKQIGQNQEMTNYTQGLYDSRELAMERMQAEAFAVQAEGIVGMQIHENNHGWGSQVIEYFAVGTAVTPIAQASPVPTPALVLPLNG